MGLLFLFIEFKENFFYGQQKSYFHFPFCDILFYCFLFNLFKINSIIINKTEQAKIWIIQLMHKRALASRSGESYKGGV